MTCAQWRSRGSWAVMEGAADWQCPNPSCINHTKMVFASKESCPKCGSSRDGGYAGQAAYGGAAVAANGQQGRASAGMCGGDMPGDWQCSNTACINHTKMVFAKHNACPSCSTAKNAKQPGDWQCPNKQCLNNKNTVYASKTSCPKCGSPRPGVGQSPVVYMPQMSYPPVQAVGNGYMMPVNGFGAGGGNLGEWQCPNGSCINNRRMVFAKHAACPQCGSPKGPQKAVGGGGNPGDWQCPNPDCVNHRNKVFAKHASCPACGAEKTGGFGSLRGRSRSPYRTAAV